MLDSFFGLGTFPASVKASLDLNRAARWTHPRSDPPVDARSARGIAPRDGEDRIPAARAARASDFERHTTENTMTASTIDASARQARTNDFYGALALSARPKSKRVIAR